MLTKQFQMSTHCHPPDWGVLYGTRGTPMGIIFVTCRLGPLLCLQSLPSHHERQAP